MVRVEDGTAAGLHHMHSPKMDVVKMTTYRIAEHLINVLSRELAEPSSFLAEFTETRARGRVLRLTHHTQLRLAHTQQHKSAQKDAKHCLRQAAVAT